MMRKKILTLAIFVGAMLLLTATAALAASPPDGNLLPVPQEEMSIITPTMGITKTVAVAIAKFFSTVVFTPTYTVTVQSVLGLHASGVGYGEIAMCFFLAQATGSSPTEILALRQGDEEEKVGWGEIITSLDLTPGNRGRNLGGIRSGRGIPADDAGVEVESASTKGPPHEPKGWEHGKGQGSQGQGKGKGPKH